MSQTEFPFRLPMGYLDENGTQHTDGTMRLATADELITALKDHRVQQNSAFLTVLLLSLSVTRLGEISVITTKVIEDLFAADFAYLQEMYNRINTD